MDRAVRTISVSRRMTALLLVLVTLGIVLVTLWMSGRVYEKITAEPFRDLRLLYDRMSAGPVPIGTVVALLMPTILNMLIFLPWGFLAFIVLDTPDRPALQSYLLTVLLGITFSAGVEAYQYFLPTRVMDVNDVIANGLGALCGAILGHLRKRVRVAFE